MTKTFRRFCFTLNNYTNEEAAQLCVEPTFTFLFYGHEVGSSGTPHLQGYIVFRDPHYYVEGHPAKFLKQINPRISWRPANGTEAENIRYCGKEGKTIRIDRRKSGPEGGRPRKPPLVANSHTPTQEHRERLDRDLTLIGKTLPPLQLF